MRRKRKHNKHSLRREKRAVGIKTKKFDFTRERLKRARDKILIYTTIYLGDQYERWTKNNQELSETRFPFCGPAEHF